MVYLDITKSNYNTGNVNLVDELEGYISNKNNKIFILFFMEGCGPCNATRPEWKKIKNVLSKDFLNRKDIVIVSIDYTLAEKLNKYLKQPNSFPTIRYVSNQGKIVENYEDSDVTNKDRKLDSLIEWIKLKTGEKNITKSENQLGGRKYSKYFNKKTQKMRGGKWSLKYKKSINCKKPKGFSQKQYCKYGRKK
jgi:hypothetical protein